MPYSLALRFEEGFDEGRRDRRDEGITIAAQSSHAVGSPMSQRECAGFNWPILPVATGDPVGFSPESVNQTCRPSNPLIGAVPTELPSL
jgi:hypothetical protein